MPAVMLSFHYLGNVLAVGSSYLIKAGDEGIHREAPAFTTEVMVFAHDGPTCIVHSVLISITSAIGPVLGGD